VHDDEQGVLVRMRKLRSRGKSYDATARTLNGSGVPAKREVVGTRCPSGRFFSRLKSGVAQAAEATR
jgi:hypothetical protein